MSERRSVPNTAGYERGGLSVLAAGLLGGDTSKAIESQERAGGEAMVESDVLPAKGIEGAVALGVTVHGPVPDDALFVYVTLPDGWARRSAEHQYGYWTEIVDEAGAVRLEVFYKAAFYDRRAFCRVLAPDVPPLAR